MIKEITRIKLTEFAWLSKNCTPGVKLPFLELKVFSGNLLEWSSFWYIFKSNIHSLEDPAPIQKFLYLRAQIHGETANLVQDLPFTDASYEEANDLLKCTYGRKKRLIQSNLQKIINLQVLEKAVAGLRKFIAAYQEHIRTLGNLGAYISESDYVFAELVLSKCPINVHDNFEWHHLGSDES